MHTPHDPAPLLINDRVSCAGKLPTDPVRVGTVVDVYSSTPNGLGQGHPLYAVQWDDLPPGEIVRGYLRIGLTFVARVTFSGFAPPPDAPPATGFRDIPGVRTPARVPKLRVGGAYTEKD